jgi:hypothetical protein
MSRNMNMKQFLFPVLIPGCGFFNPAFNFAPYQCVSTGDEVCSAPLDALQIILCGSGFIQTSDFLSDRVLKLF